MTTIAEAIKDEIGEDIGIPTEVGGVDTSPEQAQTSGFSFDFSWLRTPTGEGEIEDYLTHPLNPNGSRGLAQALRGATGFAGNLKLAIVDIVVGILNFSKERRASGAVHSIR